MDPATAFSLVGGIIQVVDFSFRVVTKCHELYRDGVSSEYKEIEEMTRHLTDLSTKLDLPNQDGSDDLLDLSSKCSSIAKELLAEIEKWKVDGPHKKRQVARKTLKTIFKGNPTERIEKRLDGYTKHLDSKILIDLRKRYNLTTLQQNEMIQDLDWKIQAIIFRLEQGPQSFDSLRSIIQNESLGVKRCFTDEFQRYRKDLAHDQYRQKVLMSLWFAEMYRREETVGEAHEKTFEWIFEPDGFDSSTRPWHSFVQWLEHGDGIYWINGKAGSGKSTLMNYLCRHHRTSDILKVWSGAKDIFIIKFFFWNAGTTLEKTSEGLLRSLLYQILQRFRSLTPFMLDHQMALEATEDNQQNLEPIAAWTMRRLNTAFQKAMRQVQEKCRICIFIDGLDETTEELDAAIAVIESMLSVNAKVCLSSRPEQVFANAFGSSARLRLQDLTEPDIKKYLEDKLLPVSLMSSMENHDKILHSIAGKAQGVFLWVRLAVIALVKGLRNGDCFEQLQLRVASLPSGIEAMYAKMLNNIDVSYREEAAELFQMALTGLTESLLDVTLAMCKAFDHMADMSVQEVLRLSRRNQDRVPEVCAGLLEVHQEDIDSDGRGSGYITYYRYMTLPIRYAASSEIAEMAYCERYTEVIFIHRTAIDFLRHSRPGKDFLEENTKPGYRPHSNYIRALLAKATLLRFPQNPCNIDEPFKKEANVPENLSIDDWYDHFADRFAGSSLVDNIMRNVFLEECMTASAPMILCDQVDRTLATLYQRRYTVPSLSHWSTRWGQTFSLGRDDLRISRSSSPVSFYSAKSEPMLYSSEPVDFLGLAASWGLFRYVSEMPDRQQIYFDEEYVNYLLCCSTRGLHRYHGRYQFQECMPPRLKLVGQLLTLGTNPNIYVEECSTTIWGLFLQLTLKKESLTIHSALIAAATAFLKAGADVHKQTQDREPGLNPFVTPAVKFDEIAWLEFRFEMSTLFIIRSLLEHESEWKTVEDIIVAKGGRESVTYTGATICLDGSQMFYKISKEQQESLLAVVNRAYDHYSAQCNPTRSWEQMQEEACKEYLATIGFPDCLGYSTEVLSSDTDTGDEFHESGDAQSTEDEEDYSSIGS